MADLRATLTSIDPRMPFFGAATVASRIARELSLIRYVALSVGAFGGLALVLALTGLYAVLAYLVSLRRREIGVRVAIGAGPRDVMALIVRQSLWLVGIGGLAGFALAVPLAFLIRAALSWHLTDRSARARAHTRGPGRRGHDRRDRPGATGRTNRSRARAS